MAKRTYKKQPKPPNTELSFEEYKEKALDLYHNKGLKKNKIMAELGTPYWEGKEWFVEFSKKDPNKFTRVQAEKKVKLLETRESREIFVDEEVENWAKRLDKEGKWPKGKSLAKFEAIEKGLETKLFKEIDRLKALGIDASDGHIVALANANITTTPLEKIGKGGSHSARARIPEILDINRLRGKKPQLYDLPKDVLRGAGIPTTSAEAFQLYLTDNDQGTGVHLTQKDKQRIHIGGENPDAVIADRYNYVEGKKIEAANKARALTESVKNKTNQLTGVQAFTKQQLNPTQIYDATFISKNGNGVNGRNWEGQEWGVNGRNGNGLTVNGKNGKNGFLKGLGNVNKYSGITKIGRSADQLANIGVNVSTGNYVGAGIGVATYGTSKALQNKQVQARVAKQITKLVAERGAKSAAKMIPGLDILLSSKESWDYLKRGRWDQAGIAALSGAIGWIPVVGDGASAALDLSNTGIDIARLQAPTGAKKKKNRNTLTRFLKGLNT